MPEVDRTRVEKELSEIRRFLQADGGDVELVDIKEGVVQVRLRGACAGCPGARMTLEMGVQRRLQQAIPEVVAVEAV